MRYRIISDFRCNLAVGALKKYLKEATHFYVSKPRHDSNMGFYFGRCPEHPMIHGELPVVEISREDAMIIAVHEA